MSVQLTSLPPQRARVTFDDFVRARLPELLRFGRALAGDEQRGGDLVQDALVRCLARWNRIRSDDPEGYVRMVMVHRNISVWRSLRRERLTDEVPDRALVDRPRDEALWAALRTLPPRQRTVIALRYLSDQTEAQTAHLMGCSAGTVKSQANAAMHKLRQMLDNTEEES